MINRQIVKYAQQKGKNTGKYLADSLKYTTFARAKEKNGEFFCNRGLFVYRLGRKIFILERGVRFPYGLQFN